MPIFSAFFLFNNSLHHLILCSFIVGHGANFTNVLEQFPENLLHILRKQKNRNPTTCFKVLSLLHIRSTFTTSVPFLMYFFHCPCQLLEKNHMLVLNTCKQKFEDHNFLRVSLIIYTMEIATSFVFES